MGFYETITAPTITPIIERHLDVFTSFVDFPCLEIAVTHILVVTTLAVHGGVTAKVFSAFFTGEAVQNAHDISHVSFYIFTQKFPQMCLEFESPYRIAL